VDVAGQTPAESPVTVETSRFHSLAVKIKVAFNRNYPMKLRRPA